MQNKTQPCSQREGGVWAFFAKKEKEKKKNKKEKHKNPDFPLNWDSSVMSENSALLL